MSADPILNQVVQAIKSGDKATARSLIASYLKTNPKSAPAWYLAANALEDKAKQIDALQRLLAIAPDYQPAKRMLAKLHSPDELETLLSHTPPLKRNTNLIIGAAALAVIAVVVIIGGIVMLLQQRQQNAAATATGAVVAAVSTATAQQQLTQVEVEAATSRAIVAFLTETLPPTWTPAYSPTPVPTDTPIPTAIPTITDVPPSK